LLPSASSGQLQRLPLKEEGRAKAIVARNEGLKLLGQLKRIPNFKCRSQHEIRFEVVRKHGAYLIILGIYGFFLTTAALANQFSHWTAFFASLPQSSKF